MKEQAPDEGKRGFLKNLLGLGALGTIGGAVGILEMSGDENIENETFSDSLQKLLGEMKYIERVPVVKTSSNENVLTEAGWYRLSKIMHEKFSDRKANPDAFITRKELEEIAGK